jgi:hypothetical protein
MSPPRQTQDQTGNCSPKKAKQQMNATTVQSNEEEEEEEATIIPDSLTPARVGEVGNFEEWLIGSELHTI